jgi:hypothetical protein
LSTQTSQISVQILNLTYMPNILYPRLLSVFFSRLEMLLSYFIGSSIFLLFLTILFIISPIFGFFLSLLVWWLVPYFSGFISFELGLLFFYGLYKTGRVYCYNYWMVF